MTGRGPAGPSLAMVGALLGVLLACDTTVEPLESGSVAFDFMAEGETEATSWAASGSCGPPGFVLGAETCAVGTEESRFWSVLGVVAHGDGVYDYIVLAAPRAEGTCEVSPETSGSDLCTGFFSRETTNLPEEEVATWLLTSGTITLAIEDGDRLVGSFEGTAEDQSSLERPPLTITGGTFDVEFVR